MQYEAHITVEDFPSVREAIAFHETCKLMDFGAKALFLELTGKNHPEHPLHLMLAAKETWRQDKQAEFWVQDLLSNLAEFQGMGRPWKVNRVKLESPIQPGPADYYEAHWKIQVRGEEDRALMSKLQKHTVLSGALFHSRNLFEKGTEYLTARILPPYTHEDAEIIFDGYHRWLTQLGLKAEKVHQERVISDSNPDWDLGWAKLSPSGGTADAAASKAVVY
jgi:hypothetical protein